MNGVLATARAAAAEAGRDRVALVVQAGFMVLNNCFFIAFWGFVFRRVDTLRGWDFEDLVLLNAVLCTGAGGVLGLLANVRRIPDLVADGGLDAVLALPVRTLPTVLVRRVEPINFGDLVFGIGAFLWVGDRSPAGIGAFVVVTALGATVFASFCVFTGSLTFFTGRREAGEVGLNVMVMLSSYPADVLGGAARAVVFSVVPAAFVATVPVEVLRDLDVTDFAALAGMAVLCATIASATFTLGLRRYTSSSLWSRA